MKAVLITIGNEILNGQVVDTNAAWLAQGLLEIGIPVQEKWSVGDEIEEITGALDRGTLKADVIITTGGLGPTRDDLTCEAIAGWMKVDRVFHTGTFEKLTKIFASLGRVPTDAHRIQCMLPEGVTILPNNNGTAPGMYFDVKGKHIISMPGVPFEMKAIFDPYVKELLNGLKKGPKRMSHTFNTVGEGETVLEDLIKNITNRAPNYIGFAFLPDIYKVRIRVDVDSESADHLKEYEKILEEIRVVLKDYIVGENENVLEIAIGNLVKGKKWELGTAESCTGGYVSHLITSIPGSSEYFKGGIISYSNELKQSKLNVASATLEKYGAVSEQTVKEMALGALTALNVNVAVSISGIAGPAGGTAEKPVGLIWIAVANAFGKVTTKKIQLRRDRLLNIRAASNMALITLYRFLSDE